MVGTDDGAIQEAPNVRDGVRVDVAANVFARAVVNGLVNGVLVADATVGCPLVSEYAVGNVRVFSMMAGRVVSPVANLLGPSPRFIRPAYYAP